ncbi:MAG: peptide-methionine (S)-S-oxide reductase, partial [Acidobacteriota bacterium]|nr:peptide-methionine (S)-S-oxide reductase [Acidobacteriota bacterium]
MYFNSFKFLLVLLCGAATACSVAESSSKPGAAAPTPPAVVAKAVPNPKDEQTAVFAGGCFWG